MLRCSQVARLISSDEYLAARRLQIRLHLAMCRNCRRYARQLRALAAALRKTEDPVSPSEIEAARGRILRGLSEK